MNRLEERVADQLIEVIARAISTEPRRVTRLPTWRRHEEQAKAALSALEAQGLKIVPVEPTEESLSGFKERQPKKPVTAWLDADVLAHFGGSSGFKHKTVNRILRAAMLNAVEG